ncbi:unnamed protein product [Urochloa decumbens]|uniref:Uncharacterized protein n=1 Tax=Urochloa decumbens TaxID=240449 RepID=A0ABC8VYT8_9POAL
MESALVKAALSVVGTALSPFKDSLLEKWAATNKLGSNVKDLELELLAVQALLEHTVGKEIVDNSALKRLLVTLQDLGYDAEDVLDELEYFRIQDKLDSTFEAADEHATGCACDLCLHVCHTGNAACKQIASWFTCFCAVAPAGCKARLHDHVGKHSPCSCLPCVRDGSQKLKFDRVDASTRMKHIVEKLRVVRGIVSSTFTALGSDNLIIVPDIAQSRPTTTSESTEPKLYGRDHMKNSIIHDITEGKHSCEALTIIPIVGLGGIGKTALTQHIYHSEKVRRHFKVKVWTCVSLNFNVNRLIEEIKEGIPKVHGESGTASELIEQRLKMKRFLLVLDDIWDCRNEDEWKQLLAPFKKSQVHGNIIMVTTRFRAQAQIMIQKDDHTIYLKGLGDKEFKELFRDIAFADDRSRQDDTSLLKIADEIVDKLKGSPLAAKTVGRLLKTHIDLEHWKRVLKSKEWMETEDGTDIIPALKLSYYYLPAQLQQCFSYCSLFPQDYKFESEELINFWIGLDLLHSLRGENKRVEDVGLSHLTELVNYGFFEMEGKKDGSTCYIIHDLLHELAQKVSSHECLSIESSQYQVFGDLFRKTNALRVIFLSKASYDVEDLLKNFYNLVHLRYLRIESSPLVETRFPTRLSRFYHMVVLDAKHCYINNDLPRDMRNLVKLRYFLVQNDAAHSGIVDVGKLKLLQELRRFVVKQDGQGFELKQIGQLVQLSGSLCIDNLETVQAMEEAGEAKLIEKDSLDELILRWNSRSTIYPALEENVLERLRPSSNLQKLSIIQHGGANCPSWLGTNPSVKSLESLCLNGVAWKTFPPIGVNEPRQEISCNIPDKMFENLTRLELLNLPWLENWAGPCQLFPGLLELKIGNCPRLLSIPLVPWTSKVCSIQIEGIGSPCLHKLVCVKKYSKYSLTIEGKDAPDNTCWDVLAFDDNTCWDVLAFDNLTKLERLIMVRCQPLPLHHLEKLSSLTGLKMSCSSNAFPFVEGKQYRFPVESLHIEQWSASGKELTQLLTYFPKLSELRLLDCEKITQLGVMEQQETATPIPSSIVPLKWLEWYWSELSRILTCCRFNTFQSPPIPFNPSQTEQGLNELLLLPPQLNKLSIYHFPNLSLHPRTGGGGEGLQGLRSLQHMDMGNCPKLLSSDSSRDSSSSFSSCFSSISSDSSSSFSSCFSSLSSYFPFPNSLEDLVLLDAVGMETLVPLSNLTSLSSLSISGFRGLRGDGLLSLLAQGHLTKLNLIAMPELSDEQELPSSPSRLHELSIVVVTAFTSTRISSWIFSSLTTLKFEYNEGFKFFTEEQEDLLFVNSLEDITFNYYSSLQYLPARLHTLPNLKRLMIWRCTAIKKLPKDGLPSSLQELVIVECPKIRSLPKNCIPSSLQKLDIRECPAIRSLPMLDDLPGSLIELDVHDSRSKELRRQCRKLIGTIPVVIA